jgi:phage shock protein A
MGFKLKGGFLMATRDSMETLLQQCEDAIRYAQEQYEESSVQQHYNNDGYTEALQTLEQSYQDVCKMAHSANSQQRDQLHRMRLQLQDLQNKMILQGP